MHAELFRAKCTHVYKLVEMYQKQDGYVTKQVYEMSMVKYKQYASQPSL